MGFLPAWNPSHCIIAAFIFAGDVFVGEAAPAVFSPRDRGGLLFYRYGMGAGGRGRTTEAGLCQGAFLVGGFAGCWKLSAI